MLNKFRNLFIRQSQFSIRVIIIFALILASPLLVKKQQLQAAQIEKIKAQKQLVAKIPELEKEMQRLESLHKKAIVKKEFDFKGILISNNARYAVIGDKFYKEGEDFDNYIVYKITTNFVIIENQNTREKKVLYLP